MRRKKYYLIFLEEKGQHIIKYWNWCAKSTLATLQTKLLITKETSQFLLLLKKKVIIAAGESR